MLAIGVTGTAGKGCPKSTTRGSTGSVGTSAGIVGLDGKGATLAGGVIWGWSDGTLTEGWVGGTLTIGGKLGGVGCLAGCGGTGNADGLSGNNVAADDVVGTTTLVASIGTGATGDTGAIGARGGT